MRPNLRAGEKAASVKIQKTQPLCFFYYSTHQQTDQDLTLFSHIMMNFLFFCIREHMMTNFFIKLILRVI